MLPNTLSIRQRLQDEWHSKVSAPLAIIITKPTFALSQLDNNQLRSYALFPLSILSHIICNPLLILFMTYWPLIVAIGSLSRIRCRFGYSL